MPDPTVDDLLTEADRYVGIGANPRSRYALVRDLAAALRAKTAETEKLNEELHQLGVGRERMRQRMADTANQLRAELAEAEEIKRGQVVIHELQSQVRNYTKALAEAHAVAPRFSPQQLAVVADWFTKHHGHPCASATLDDLRQMLEHDDRCESEWLNPPGAYTPCGCADRRAAAPQPLWQGETSKIFTFGKRQPDSVIEVRVDVPPGTEVAVYAADQTPAVTREQVHTALTEVARQHGVGGKFTVAMADAAWALLSGEGQQDG